ncbi:hypothetical protein [Nonomuraea indica]|uniref:hypothetical protein n=1 Tax=Nonomuraea indica TaxID=1581193 RepID=UPI0011831046|nr:hypothetical protein [Nonomuraea indica]
MRKPTQKGEDAFESKKMLKRWTEATFFTIGAVVLVWGAAHRRGVEMAILAALVFGFFPLTYWIPRSRLPRWCQEPAFIYSNVLLLMFCVLAVVTTPLSLEVCLGLSAFMVILLNTIHRRRIDREVAEAAEVRVLESQWVNDHDDR